MVLNATAKSDWCVRANVVGDIKNAMSGFKSTHYLQEIGALPLDFRLRSNTGGFGSSEKGKLRSHPKH